MDNFMIEGLYGPFTIDSMDDREVLGYRLAFLCIGLSLTGLLVQWKWYGGSEAWAWILPMIISLGLALRWIHIYLRFLHRILQLFWFMGATSLFILVFKVGLNNLLPLLANQTLSIWPIAPFFVSLVGLGIKEFFCFRRPEAIGIILLLPISLLGRLSGLLNKEICFILLASSACSILTLAINKFSVKSAADVGDKSIFSYVEAQRKNI